MSVVFSEYWTSTSNRAFTITITNVLNPNKSNQFGSLALYAMNINSNLPVLSSNLAGLSTTFYPLTAALQSPGVIPFASVFSFPSSSSPTGGILKGVQQHVEFLVTTAIAIPAGKAIKITFVGTDVAIIAGSGFIDKTILPNDPSTAILYSYPTTNVLVITNLAALPLSTPFVISCRVFTTTSNPTVYAYVRHLPPPPPPPHSHSFRYRWTTAHLRTTALRCTGVPSYPLL